MHWVKYRFFLYYKSHLSKFLYFESYKFWKLANIKVSIFCNDKNLEFVCIIYFKHQKVSIGPRAKPGNCSTESLSIGYGLISSSGQVRSNSSKIIKTDDFTGGTREEDPQGWLRAVRVRVKSAELIS